MQPRYCHGLDLDESDSSGNCIGCRKHPGGAVGVSPADLKAPMGHDSVRAAMIYQHAAAEADQKIANTLDQRMGRLVPVSTTKAS